MKIVIDISEDHAKSIKEYLSTQNVHVEHPETGQHHHEPKHDGIPGLIADILHDPFERIYQMFPPTDTLADHFKQKHAADRALKHAVRLVVTAE